MSFVKRAIYAITRRKTKTIILMVLFIIIANLVLAGFAIQNATKAAGNLARQKLGGNITLSFDMQKIMQEQFGRNQNNGGERVSLGRVDVTVEPITQDMINKIMEVDYVVDYNITVGAQGYADGFEPVVANEAEGREAPQGEARGAFVIGGGTNGGTLTMPDLTISGVTSTYTTSTFKDGTEKLIEGEGIVGTDTEKTVVIEKQLAAANDLSIGDKIKIKSSSEGESIELTIIGIYETTENNSMAANIAFMQAYNKIYVNVDTALELKKLASQDSSSGRGIRMGGSTDGIDSVVFSIDDPVNMEQALAAIAKTDIDWDKFTVDANNVQYEQMMGPIENVASFSMMVVWIVGIAGGIILALILTLWIKERMYETGVLLSLGETRLKIIFQYMTEVLVIGILAFSLSIFTGKYISKSFGESLLNKELAVQEESNNQNGPLGGRGMPVVIGNSGTLIGGNNVEAIDEIDVSVDSNSIIKLYSVGLGIILIGTAIPGIMVMRYNPRRILTNAG